MFIFDDKWGLVLAGGGGKGAFQIGAFKAMKELIQAFRPCGIAGTSVGALNAALYSLEDYDLSEKIWSNISNDQFMHLDLDLIDFKEGLFSRQGMLDIIHENVDISKISNYSVPVFCTTSEFDISPDTDVKHVVYHRLNGKSESEITTILLASSAMPIAYEPILFNGKYHKDGGLCDNTPVRPLYDMGIRKFIVISMDTDATINRYEFPDATFLHIKPSRTIGDLTDGTLDFDSNNARIRMKQGYFDARRAINSYSGQEYYEDYGKLTDLELLEFKQLEYDFRREKLENQVNDTFGKLDSILSKYGIEER